MALSQPRSDNRASKHMRVASVAGTVTGHRAASVTAGMQPRNVEALRKLNEREQADKADLVDAAPRPKGVLRGTIKPLASSVASVAPRMVKFKSNIQYLGEKVGFQMHA